MKARVVLVTADRHKGFGDWIIALPAMKLLRDKWGAYLELVAISPPHLMCLVEMSGVFDACYEFRLDWPEYYGYLLDNSLGVIALMDSDLFVWEDITRRTARYNIQNCIYRNKYWKDVDKQHLGLIVARNLDMILGYDPISDWPLEHPLTRWTPPGGRIIAIHAGRGPTWKQGAKDWPYFFNLCKLLQGAGYDPVQIVGPDDPVLDQIPTWRGTTAELAGMLLHCIGFVGNDSGPGHLAGALGLPTHVIFGVMDPKNWHPIGPRVTWSWSPDLQISKVTVSEVFSAVTGKLAAYTTAA